MSLPTTSEYWNQTNPPAPAGDQTIVIQTDGAVPLQSLTAYPKVAIAPVLGVSAGSRGVVMPDGTSITMDPDGTLHANTSEDVAFIEAVQQQLYIFAVDTGAANAYAVALNPAPDGVEVGSVVVVLFTNANTGPSTLAVNGGTPTPITKDGDFPLSGGEIAAGQILSLVFDPAGNFQIVGGTGGSGSGGGGGNPQQVVPTPPPDGVNKVFTLPEAAAPGTGNLYVNGVLQNPLGASPDYTLSTDGLTITMADAPVVAPEPDWLLFTYVSGVIGNGPVGPQGPVGPAGSTPTVPITLVFLIFSGTTGTNVTKLAARALRAGSLTKCKVDVAASDPTTALTFKIKQNGTDIFSTDPTIAGGAGAGSLSTFTTLTTSPLAVAQDDRFTLDITSGSSNWAVTIYLE